MCCTFSSSAVRRAIDMGNADRLTQLLEEAGQAAPDLINEDYTSDCLFNPFFRNYRPPLQTAILKMRPNCTEVLLQYGADVNARGYFSETALHLAARFADPGLIKRLVELQGDLYMRDNTGKYPIHTAVHPVFGSGTKGDETVTLLKCLLEEVGKQSDVNLTDDLKNTPLHYAAKSGNKAAVEYLLTRGADPHYKNTEGQTPVDVAPKKITDLFASASVDLGIIKVDDTEE